MNINSYAKINLSLKVNSKQKSSLHEIQTYFCLIDLADKIKINKTKGVKDKIIFKGKFARSINKRNNSIINLLNILRRLKLISSYYSIKVIKNIPVFGGLGGGTSNAAFILKYLLKKRLNKNLLNELKSKIGSDIVLFFKKQGFMKNLKLIIGLKKKNFHFVLIQPKIRCSTKDIYSRVKKFSRKERLDKKIANSKNRFLTYLSTNKNDLQFVVERKHPFIKKLLADIKKEKGCHFSRMTGSGSVCYGLFNHKIIAKKALKKLKKKYPKLWFSLAKTV